MKRSAVEESFFRSSLSASVPQSLRAIEENPDSLDLCWVFFDEPCEEA